MKQLNNTAQALQTDPLHRISVTDLATGRKIAENLSGQKIIEKYGSIEQFFEGLKQFSNVRIYNRRANGSSSKPIDYFDLTIEAGQNEPPAPVPAPQQQRNSPVLEHQNNNGLMGMYGLNMSDAIFKTRAYDELKVEHDRLKDKFEALQKENDAQKLEIMKHDFSNTKSKNNTDLIQSFLNSPLAAPIAAKLFGGEAAPVAGLAAPEPALSQTKNFVFAQFRNMDDSFLQELYYLAVKMVAEDQAFDNELESLMEKYNVIPAQANA